MYDKIGGASAGALAACCLLCDLPLATMASDFLRIVKEARRHSLGPFSPSFNIQNCLLEGLQRLLPSDAHDRVTGRLHISLTRICDGRNVIASEFHSRQDLMQALLCSCFIPGFSGILPPRWRGVRYVDGAFSNNLPILDENTVTVSPFSGESDICPRDQSSKLFQIHLNWANTSFQISRRNFHRLIHIILPAHTDFLSSLCHQGFADALEFLHCHNMISIRKCRQYFFNEMKHGATLLDRNSIQNHLGEAKRNFPHWMFHYSGLKLLALPAILPMDVLLATIAKIGTLRPKLAKQMSQLLSSLTLSLHDPPHFDLVDATSRLRWPRTMDPTSSKADAGDKHLAYKDNDNKSTAKVKAIEIFDFKDIVAASKRAN
ncbi:1-acylglycerol-3-phosphate O-acyltransferase Pnpla3-like isoform X1 [Drosophila tropicalis]|uniref:1-acylglycerol-3-phosphate O-acyltransferase Pnpla3-like isoform X1 n=2 Tax=Drosophila tropicalis TaxID=46794 RepID=UPI0035AC2500